MRYPLAPSDAGTWVNCHGSIIMRKEPTLPDVAGPTAEEGTAAHWVGANRLRSVPVALGLMSPNGIPVDSEMIRCAEIYAQEVESWGIPLEFLHIEETMHISDVHELNGGTPDVWGFDMAAGVVRVADYKYGHRYVDAWNNWQLINYALGILQKLGIDGRTDRTITVIFSIIQPRVYTRDAPIRHWSIKASDLRGHRNELIAAAQAAFGPSPKTKAGYWCEFCSARHRCDTLARAAYRSVAIAGDAVPFDLSPTAMGNELKTLTEAKKLLDARITGLSEQVMHTLRSGKDVPHYMIGRKAGRQKWTAEKLPELLPLAGLFGVKVDKALDYITPKQAIEAGLPKDVVDKYSQRGYGEPELIEAPNAARIFGE